MGKVEKDRTAGFIELDHEGLDLPEGNHNGQDEKSRERMNSWIHLNWIMRGRMGKLEKEWTAEFI